MPMGVTIMKPVKFELTLLDGKSDDKPQITSEPLSAERIAAARGTLAKGFPSYALWGTSGTCALNSSMAIENSARTCFRMAPAFLNRYQ